MDVSRSRSARLAALLAGAAVLLAGCGGTDAAPVARPSVTDSPAPSPAGPSDGPAAGDRAGMPGIHRYVALGDSYTSAPYVGVTDIADGCYRSQTNYPHLFAAAHGIDELVDVSCAGATTQDLAQSQLPTGSQVRVPPQLSVLTPDTDLVTLGIGGNDNGLFGEVARACTGQPSGSATSCKEAVGADLSPIGRDVERALREVQRRAPGAEVVLIGYPRILDGHRCPARLAVDPDDVAALSALPRRLGDELAGAARRTGVRYLDLYAASAGHDVCSARPWVNGARSQPGRAAALHPFVAEQQAVARLLTAALAR